MLFITKIRNTKMEGTAKNHRTLTLKRLSKGVSYTADID